MPLWFSRINARLRIDHCGLTIGNLQFRWNAFVIGVVLIVALTGVALFYIHTHGDVPCRLCDMRTH